VPPNALRFCGEASRGRRHPQTYLTRRPRGFCLVRSKRRLDCPERDPAQGCQGRKRKHSHHRTVGRISAHEGDPATSHGGVDSIRSWQPNNRRELQSDLREDIVLRPVWCRAFDPQPADVIDKEVLDWWLGRRPRKIPRDRMWPSATLVETSPSQRSPRPIPDQKLEPRQALSRSDGGCRP